MESNWETRRINKRAVSPSDLHRYTTKVMRELALDQKSLSDRQTDRQRFLLKAVENYIRCLEGGEHDTWVFRLASLWLENAGVKVVNDMMKVRGAHSGSRSVAFGRTLGASRFTHFVIQTGVERIPSYKFLPLMYQLAARMGTKMATGVTEDTGFHDVLRKVMQLFFYLSMMTSSKCKSSARPFSFPSSTTPRSNIVLSPHS